ncbi:type II toxin-antitoxin system RelE/ParE family toxin [Rhodoplanes azumiensis]|uniref:Type II toxin-antitoxin system RelE/ParE family toxin n=1 Tax=Rhodoplanes azumiensis TaxID=1897628 RepID=A0ABW5ALB8_9BRAD
MTIRFTDEAFRDLEAIVDHVKVHYPAAAPALHARLGAVLARIDRWPASARRVDGHPDIHVVPLGRHPYKVFYRVTETAVEILHIHHAAQKPWPAEDEQA